MPQDETSGLRHRTANKSRTRNGDDISSKKAQQAEEEVVWGKTPGGAVFRVPTTHDVLTSLFSPYRPKSHVDLVNLTLLGLQLILFFTLPRAIARPFFLLYYTFWRAAYDAGLGWVLTKQSKKRWMVREVQRRGWLDETRRPMVRNWIRSQLQGKMGKDYSFDDLPLEYNTWLLFRQLVDIILINDLVSYFLFAMSCFRVPENLSILLHILRWVGGISLILFNIWVKAEAHRIVKDYGWYWGDVFFERGALVFDGVFEMAPHPMYSVGYAGYYGLSMIVGSYPVLFVSLATHAAQFAFLAFFENPHIDRMYGTRQPLAARTPLQSQTHTPRPSTPIEPQSTPRPVSRTLRQESIDWSTSTPSATDAETATEPDTEGEYQDAPEHTQSKKPSLSKASRHGRRGPTLTQHDLLNRYFRKDVIGLRNLDLLRASDFKLLLLVLYILVPAFLPSVSTSTMLVLLFIHALLWRFFHSFALGYLLRAQSERKFLVRHFMKNYFHAGDVRTSAIDEAFSNWKQFYNMSLCMTYASFIALALKTYSIPVNWGVGDQLLRHVLGASLIALHAWTAVQSYEVLGVFGWFFGDFFIEDYPATLVYTGIYRFLNSPERTTGGAAFYGLSIISGSKVVFALAVISHLSHWWFLSNVENPHMRKVYGDSLRKEAGLTKTIRNVAVKNARMIESRAGRHAPDLRRVAQEVRGTFEKVFEETAEVVEDFLAKSRPMISEVMQDTKVLLQQSRERLVITPVSSDLSAFDKSKYSISVVANGHEGLRFYLGELITISWKAPSKHSRQDWVGIYRYGANKSVSVTKVKSLSWVPVHNEEWDGDVPLETEKLARSGKAFLGGEIVFKGEDLPWEVGRYEFRYHHDGKYSVMCVAEPIEIYVDKPATFDFTSIHDCLLRIISLALDSDPSLMPLSSLPAITEAPDSNENQNPDDFRFWSEGQAKRIAEGIKQAFDVDCAPEVILADANVTLLTNLILAAREL